MSRARWWRRLAPPSRSEAARRSGLRTSRPTGKVRVQTPGAATAVLVVGIVAVGLGVRSMIWPTGPAGGLAFGGTVGSLAAAALEPTKHVVGEPGSRAWLARTARGSWILGRSGRHTPLAPSEIGLAVANDWLVTADERSFGRSITTRRLDGSGRRTAAVAVVPASVGVAGSKAYVGGFDRRTGGDPGLFVVALADGVVSRSLAPTRGTHPRSVVVSPDESRVVSATCDDGGRCDLVTLSTAVDGPLQLVPSPGFLRATTGTVAIVGPDPASWIAGIDLATGHELWRRSALEMWTGYTTLDGRLVQAELQATATGPVFVVEVISALTGSSRTVFRAPVRHGIGLWPELSSDDRFALGPAFSLDDGLAKAAGEPIAVHMLSVADGRDLGSAAIDGSN